jgi:hypothetical protein
MSAGGASASSSTVVRPHANYPLNCDGSSVWSDGTTFGITCYPNYDYQIGALCTDGRRAYSAWESPGVKAYAYCSEFGSHLVYPYNVTFYWN